MDYMTLRNAMLEAAISVTQARPDIRFEMGDRREGPVVTFIKNDRAISHMIHPDEVDGMQLPVDYTIR
ncbi:MAG: hypothetical protein K0R61_1173, partial [Microvirga sp.]|nr:hypothetical protein [Microvirga sp.]